MLLNPKFPCLWHGGDYNPDQWPPEVWEQDMRLMKESRFKVATIGIFSWAKLEPREGEYEFDWMDEIIGRLTDADRWFILATPSAAPPAWLSKKYPETLRTGADRVRRLHGNRVNFNLSSSIYREKCQQIARKLAERYGKHPRLLAWHLSNEYGGADYSDGSIAQFRGWLKHKFGGDLDALNHAYWNAFWSHTYGDWEEIDPGGEPYGEAASQALAVDWQRFVTDQTVEFMLNEAQPLREISPDVPHTTNLMGTYPGLDYRKFAPHLDFISWDSYPANSTPLTDPDTWIRTSFKHDLMRSLKPDRPWLLMESSPSSGNWYEYMQLKRPGMHRLEGVQALAHGSDGVQYFQWRQSRGGQEQFHGAVVGHNGESNTRVFAEVREIGELLEAHSDLAGSLPVAEVGLVYDWEIRWAVDASSGPVKGSKRYEESVFEHYGALWHAGLTVDVIGLEDAIDHYKLVIAPMAFALRPGFAERVRSFVEAGGTFIATYLTGWVDGSSLAFEGGFLQPLKEVLGVWSEELDALHPGQTVDVKMQHGNSFQLEGPYSARDFCELVHLTTAESLATFGSEFYRGRPAITCNRFGEGRAFYVASRNDPSFQEEFLTAIAKAAGVQPVLNFQPVPGVTVQRRHSPAGNTCFLLNTNGHPVTVSTGPWGAVDLPPWGADIRKTSVAER